MVKIKSGAFELLDGREYHKGDPQTITCGERNGSVRFHIDNGTAHVVSFNASIQKPHVTQHILEQLFVHLESLGSVKECIFEPSASEAFDVLLKRNGFVPSITSGLYCSKVPFPSKLSTYINNDLPQELVREKKPRIYFDLTWRIQMNIGPESEERLPTLHAYLSQNLSRQVIKIPLKPDANGISQGNVKFWYDIYLQDIPHTSHWNLACFNEIKNKHGEFCRNQAGNVMVPITDLLNACSSITTTGKYPQKTKDIVLSLQVPASPNIEKARIMIFLKNDSVRLEDSQLSHHISNEIGETEFNNEVNKYISSVVGTYKSMQPLYRGIQNIHAFQYVSSIGTLPAMLYQRFYTPPSSVPYWLNSLEIILNRHGIMDLQAFSSGEGGEKYSSRVMAEICTLYVNYCKYITDKVLKVSPTAKKGNNFKRVVEEFIESFDLVRPRDAGDCEDFGKEEQIESFQLGLSFYEQDAHPALKRLHNIRSKYYTFSALGAVASATINGDYEGEQFGAHEWLLFVPRDWFMRCVRRHDPSSPFVLPEDEGVGSELEVLVGEGTGMLRPDGEGEESFPSGREYLDSLPEGKIAFDNLRRVYFYNRETGSNFYKVVITLFTNEFLQDKSVLPHVGEFVVQTLQKQGKSLYGTPFLDFINKRDNICIFPQKDIPSELFYHVTVAQQDEYPILPLDPPVSNSKQVLTTELLYELVAYSSKVKLLPQFQENQWNPPVEYFMRFDQSTPERINNILKILNLTGGYADIQREPVSGNNVGGWRILIYLPTEIIS